MLPKTHILFGFIFSLFLFLFFPEISLAGIIIIFVSSVLIDTDHYLFYVWLKKDLSLKNSYYWFLSKSKQFEKLSLKEKKKLINPAPCFFHGIEAILVLILLSFIHVFFFYVLVGFLFHQFLDLISIVKKGYAYNHIGIQTLNLINYRKKINAKGKINIYS
jgi:hypothetical protein